MPISPYGLLDRVLHGRTLQPAPPRPVLPLQGLTILAVEDSRFASDALRLMCQRSGARLRRVDRLQTAYAHLRVYRPDVVLVDLGLPDGRGEALICDLAQQRPLGPIVIGISGDAGGHAVAMLAGAQGFLEKPFLLGRFQGEILRHLPDRADRPTPVATAATPGADPLALRDDLDHALRLVQDSPDFHQRRYIEGFVMGIARVTNDPALAAAAASLCDMAGLDPLQALLHDRVASATGAFRASLP